MELTKKCMAWWVEMRVLLSKVEMMEVWMARKVAVRSVGEGM